MRKRFGLTRQRQLGEFIRDSHQLPTYDNAEETKSNTLTFEGAGLGPDFLVLERCAAIWPVIFSNPEIFGIRSPTHLVF